MTISAELLPTLSTELAHVARQSPNKVAMQIKRHEVYEQITYAEIISTVEKIASALLSSGIGKSDKVAIILENRPQWPMVYFGILLAGAIALPIDPQSSVDDFYYYLHDAEAKLVFTSRELLPRFFSKITPLVPAEQIIVFDADVTTQGLAFAIWQNKQVVKSFPEITANDVASIVYTSGTTGKPKGVMLSHSNFLANYSSVAQLQIIYGEQNVLAILPFHHTFPFVATLLIPLFSKILITFAWSIKSDALLQCMRETGITVFVGVPQIFYLFYHQINANIKQLPFYLRLPVRALIKLLWLLRKFTHINLTKYVFRAVHQPFGNKLKFFICGGAKLNPEIELFLWQIGFTILQGYGLTETAPVDTFNPEHRAKIGSAGKAIPDVNIEIANPDVKGVGEIMIKGPNVMLGYYHKPEDTEQVLQNGWFASGDLGYLDADGYLFIVGRKKEIIVLSSGKNVSPEEVETYYSTCPFIKELCVLTIGSGEEEKLVAVIVPNFAYFRRVGEVNIYATIRWELENLAKNYSAYKRVMGFIITKDDLPRTHLGKLQRYAIKEKYEKELQVGKEGANVANTQYGDEDLQLLALSTSKIICEVILQETKLTRPINLYDHLELDLGFDSLKRVELISILEKRLGVQMPAAIFATTFSVKELILAFNKLLETNQRGEPTAKGNFSWGDIITTLPPDTLLNQIELQPSFVARSLMTLFCKLTHGLFILLFRLKVTGLEHLPRDKAMILCSNHANYLDGIFILAVLPWWLRQKIFFLGLRKMFDVPIIKNLIKLTKVIPVDAAQSLVEALQACTYVLEHNQSLLIFPEGERSIDGEIKPFRKGVGILMQELQTELIPVYIDGSFAVWPRGRKFFRLRPIKIIFGKPCNVADLREQGRALGAKDDYEAITLGIKYEVEKLII